MTDLESLRGTIDQIDAELVGLLNRRYQAVAAIGEYKKAHGLPVFDPAREARLLARLDSLNTGPMTPEILRAVYGEIMAGARTLERAGQAPETVYLDHAAATTVRPEILPLMREIWQNHFANPEAAHRAGHAERKQLAEAAQTLSQALLPHLDHAAAVIWGSGASALIAAVGLALGDLHRPVWGSFRDHPAALAMEERAAGRVHRMKLDRFAQLEPLASAGGEPAPVMGFFTWVQSEVGSVLDLARLREFRTLFPDAVVVLDAVQGAGKLAYPADAAMPDVMIVSGHKFGAPGGAALLFPTPRGRKLLPKFQALREPGYRTDRVETASALLLAESARLAAARRESDAAKVMQLAGFLRESLDRQLLPNGKRLQCSIPAGSASPYITHVLLPGYQSGVLVRMLAEKGIMAAAGSACQAETETPSAVLTAMGISGDLAWSGLRFSLSAANTEAEIRHLTATLKTLLQTY